MSRVYSHLYLLINEVINLLERHMNSVSLIASIKEEITLPLNECLNNHYYTQSKDQPMAMVSPQYLLSYCNK